MSASIVSSRRLAAVGLIVLAAARLGAAPDRLTSRPGPAGPEAKAVKPGAKFATDASARMRLKLPDGSVVLLNTNTSLWVKKDRLEVSSGEIYVETGKRKDEDPLIIETPKRQIRAASGRFDVRADKGGTSVMVTGGQVRVKDVKSPI